MNRFKLLVAILLLAGLTACGVRVAEDVPIEMRDGVNLLTDIYLPPGRGPFPVILSRLPYGTRAAFARQPEIARYFAENGIGFVSQNVRGRFGSEGEFGAFDAAQDIPDANDTIDWIVAQEWSNGIIGVMGESYGAYTALAAAASGHTAIKALASANMTIANETRVLDGAFALQSAGLWNLSMGGAGDTRRQDTAQVDLRHLPLITMGKAHGLDDGLWRSRIRGYLDGPLARRARALEYYESIRVPAVHFGGWYDVFSRGTIATWEGIRLYGGDADASEMQWLVMGPWDHTMMSRHFSDTEVPTNVGKRDVGTAAISTYGDTLLEFFTYFLKREDNGFVDVPRAQYFNIGDNDWRYSEQWPPPGSRLHSLFFHSRGNAEAADDGLLDFVPPGDEPADDYAYDPNDPVTITEGTNIWSRAPQLPDRSVLLGRDDVLTYQTRPLHDDLDVTGPIAVEIYASSSTPDTDFTAALVDVYPDGYALLIREGILRASFREKDADPSPIEPGQIYTFMIVLGSASYTVPAGHSLRVEISSSNFPRFARNLNSGEPFGMSDRIETAEQTVYHDSRYPSRLILPIMAD